MKINKIALLRFLVQLYFIICLFFAVGLFPDEVGRWLFYGIFIFGVFFCGWVCPFGTVQAWIFAVCKKLHVRQFKIPYQYQKYLQLFRYVFFFLSFFGISLSIIQLKMEFNSGLLMSLESASKYFIGLFLLLSVFTERPFCNYFCIYGATYGLASLFRIFGIKKDAKKCVHCKICDKNCPMNIAVEKTTFVRHPNCINCFKCVNKCPKKCLKYTLCFKYKKK